MKHAVLPHHTYLTQGNWNEYVNGLVHFRTIKGFSNPMARRGQDLLKILRIQL